MQPLFLHRRLPALIATITCCLVASRALAADSTTVNWFNSPTTLLRDASGNPLSAGSGPDNGDGSLVELGYFSEATSANLFAGEWVPLTAQGGTPTSLGDSKRFTGLPNGRIAFNTFFSRDSDLVNVYDGAMGDAGATITRARHAIGRSAPVDGQLLAIRFYDSNDRAAAKYNTVTARDWRWRVPDPVGEIVTIDLANSVVAFEDPANPYVTSLAQASPTPSASLQPSPTATLTPSATPTQTPSITPSPTPTPSAAPTATPAAALLNISTRLNVGTQDNVLIGGFIIHGAAPARILVRGLGPSLPVEGTLADPMLELYDKDGALLDSDDDWETGGNRQEIAATGIAPRGPQEAALVRTVNPGSYSAILRGKNETTGVGLMEIFNLSSKSDARFVNVSTRGFVRNRDDVMIGGIIVAGETDSKLLVRALGPSLQISGTLADPVLELYDEHGSLITSNDDWRQTQEIAIRNTGVSPPDDREAAILISLAPGHYTAVVRGADGKSGVALIEFYHLP